MNVLDIFSGIGGFSLGLEKAGMRTVAFCEIDPYCQKVLAKNWPGVPIFGDIRNLSARDVRDVDVIAGGFPCQDISVAGKGAGLAGERSGLWAEYRRLIGEIRPRIVIVENVAALLSRGLDVVLGDLAALGYDAEWHCISASAVGAPHRRDRLWIVANARRIDRERGRSERGGPEATGPRDWAARPGEHAVNVADATRDVCAEQTQSGAERQRTWAGGQSDALADADDARRQQQRWGVSVREELASAECGSWWFTEPAVGRVAHGIPNRVDRLHALGNAVVPQIPEIIGRAIMRSQQ